MVESSNVSKNRPNIVLIDDEVELVDLMAQMLSDQYSVKIFNSPNDFLSWIVQEDSNPDLIITDLKMPEMSGIEMVSSAFSKGKVFPTILLSGFVSKEAALDAIQIGVFKVLEKPIVFEELCGHIEELLIEHEVYKTRLEIRRLTSELKELYFAFEFLQESKGHASMSEVISLEGEAQGEGPQSFHQVLHAVVNKLDLMTQKEYVLDELRISKLRQSLLTM